MLNAYFGRLVPLMEAAGGEVHQLIGDAIMVVFKKDGDQPDHALRAARAALELQREAAAVAEGRPEWPLFRAVNLAARLESQAPSAASSSAPTRTRGFRPARWPSACRRFASRGRTSPSRRSSSTAPGPA